MGQVCAYPGVLIQTSKIREKTGWGPREDYFVFILSG